jgi:hypothetical protein
MGRRLLHWSGLGVAAGIFFLQQSAHAGERKPEVKSQKFATANPSGHGSQVSAAAFFPKGVSFAKATVTTDKTAGRREEIKAAEPGSRPERKAITFFRFTSPKLGEISVQPVVGGVNGAQLSIGF